MINSIEEALEWESTVQIPITKHDFDSITHFKKKTFVRTHPNGVRLASQRVERKEILQSEQVLVFFENEFYPITRTLAKETLSPLTGVMGPPNKTTLRKVIETDLDQIRISVNHEMSVQGQRYCAEFEIEYSDMKDRRGLPFQDQYHAYHTILAREKLLLAKIKYHGISFTPDAMNVSEMMSCIPVKMQMWNYFNPNFQYLSGFKWDGEKVKLLQTPGTFYMLSAQDSIVEEHTNAFSFLTNYCVAAEKMADRLVILEVVCATYHDPNVNSKYNTSIAPSFTNYKFHSEPLNNVEMLEYVRRNLPEGLTLFGLPVYVQTFKPAPHETTYDTNLCDGLVFVQNKFLIKWKAPTIDVLCTGKNKFKAGNNRLIHVEKFEGVVGQVYELDMNRQVLRCRNDRTGPSGHQELEVFDHSADLFSQLNKK